MDWKRIFWSVFALTLLAATLAEENEEKSSVLDGIRNFFRKMFVSSVADKRLKTSEVAEVQAEPSKNKVGPVGQKLRSDGKKKLQAKESLAQPGDYPLAKETELSRKKKRSLRAKMAQEKKAMKTKMRKENKLAIKNKKSIVGVSPKDKSNLKAKVAKDQQLQGEKHSINSAVGLNAKSNLKIEVAKDQQKNLHNNKTPLKAKSNLKVEVAKDQQKNLHDNKTPLKAKSNVDIGKNKHAGKLNTKQVTKKIIEN